MTGPTSGSVSSWEPSAVLRLTSAAGGGPVAGTARGRDPGRRRQAHQDLLAVDQDPGQVEPGHVDARPHAARRLQGVDHARAGVEDRDPRAAHLARDVDRDRRRLPRVAGGRHRPGSTALGTGSTGTRAAAGAATRSASRRARSRSGPPTTQ